jgi:hypothetical protein
LPAFCFFNGVQLTAAAARARRVTNLSIMKFKILEAKNGCWGKGGGCQEALMQVNKESGRRDVYMFMLL